MKDDRKEVKPASDLRTVTPVRRKLPRVASKIKAGPTRRGELDHVGHYNF